MSRTLIVIGLAMAAAGCFGTWIARLGIGRLPGDIWIERDNFTFYAPIASGILAGLVLSLVLWLLSRCLRTQVRLIPSGFALRSKAASRR